MMEEHNQIQPLDPMGEENGDVEHTEGAAQETPLGVPFGWFGITLLLNILQYMVFLGLSMIVLIIIRVFMPANMLP